MTVYSRKRAVCDFPSRFRFSAEVAPSSGTRCGYTHEPGWEGLNVLQPLSLVSLKLSSTHKRGDETCYGEKDLHERVIHSHVHSPAEWKRNG